MASRLRHKRDLDGGAQPTEMLAVAESSEAAEVRALPPRRAEQRALDAACNFAADSILCTTLGRAQAAVALARQRPQATVCCWFLDQYQQQLAAGSVAGDAANLTLACQSDPPGESCDLAVVPLGMAGDAELARDVLQSAAKRLRIGGVLIAAVDNPHDRWLRQQLGAWFGKVTAQHHDDSVVYLAHKTSEPRKWKDFRCEFAFRDHGRLIRAVSRPGVFSHRRIDPGARQLLAAAEVRGAERVLDLGCGAGVVGLALAAREPTAKVHAVDSHARAVECTRSGADLNGSSNVTVELNAYGFTGEPGSFDLVVANPPYYGDFRIAAAFLETAHRALRPGGRVLLVTKNPQWYLDAMPQRWNQVGAAPSKRYHIVSAVRP
jgi:16S rRNA (guanine1207-N2)-methyltransferase